MSTKTFGRDSNTTATTPSGSRIFVMWMPLGRSRSISVSPTGSGSSATYRTPSTIALKRAGVSVRRSTIDGARPFAFAAATSSAFAASISGFAASSASAIASNAAFFSRVSSVRSARAAARAFFPRD